MAKIRPLFISEEYNSTGQFSPPNPYGHEVSVGREMQGGDDEDMERDLQADIGAQPINAFPMNEVVTEFTREQYDQIIKKIFPRFGINQEPEFGGQGTMGVIYFGDGKVFKLTTDKSEVGEASKIINQRNSYLADIYGVYKIYKNLYLILCEKLITDYQHFESLYYKLDEIYLKINPYGISVLDMFDLYKKNVSKFNKDYKPKFDQELAHLPDVKIFFDSILRIIDELKAKGIHSKDYHIANLGYKANGNIGFFDFGMSDGKVPKDIDVIMLENQLYERVLSYMPGSKAMTVKKKCQLGGNGDGTSTACNQGDISNLELSGIKEEEGVDGFHMDDAHKEIVNMDMDSALHETIQNDSDFKKWFGNSEMKDKKGEPIIFYHGSKNNFGSFDSSKIGSATDAGWLGRGFYFYSDEHEAAQYGRVTSYYLKITNPYYATDEDNQRLADLNSEEASTEFSENLKSEGYDGVYYNGNLRGETVVFEPNQIWKIDTTDLNESMVNEISNEDLAYRKWKRDNVTYRGISDTTGQDGDNGGMAMLGRGLYSVPASNKIMARKYGKLRILVNAKPKNPKIFNTLNEWEIWFQNNVVFPISKAKGKTYPDGRDVNSITDEMLKRGYDGVIIKGREIVNYKPENVRYYENDRQLEMYYDDFVRNNSMEEEIKIMIDEVMVNDFSYIPENIEINVNSLPFKTEIEQAGGKIYSVGGAVRDHILQKPSKDLDLLITGLPLDKLEVILAKYGKVDAVGKSFGIIKFNTPKTGELDIAIPRTEKATGQGGYQGFDVKSDHELPIEKDLERRDFTINAIAKDAEGNLIDPYHGEEDIKNKIIRMVNPQAFKDDPLRMIRAVQFAARFGFTIEPETLKAIQENASRIKEISPERILIEFDKIVKKGNPVIGAQLLEQTGLYQQIFGVENKINYTEMSKVKSMGEFIYILTSGAVTSPAEFYKDSLKGDIDTYNEIRAYELAYKTAKPNDVQTKLDIFGMYKLSPKSLESEIIPQGVKENVSEMKKMGMPFSMKDLQINGNDLLALGYTGQQIGKLLKDLIVDIYSGKLRNNRDLLLRHLTPKIQEV